MSWDTSDSLASPSVFSYTNDEIRPRKINVDADSKVIRIESRVGYDDGGWVEKTKDITFLRDEVDEDGLPTDSNWTDTMDSVALATWIRNQPSPVAVKVILRKLAIGGLQMVGKV